MSELQAWLASTIRAEAAARGLNVRQLGIRAGIADKVLRRALDCERPLHFPQLEKIAGALSVPVTFLVTEAERRQDMASPDERAAKMIEGDLNLTREQKTTLIGQAGN